MESLSALSTFVHAAEVRSFTEAGRQLGLSSSAVGKAVARLEDQLGVRLLHRNTRSISLTQEGKRFLESCRRILSELETIELEFAQARGAPRGRLSVSLPSVTEPLLPALGRFMRAYPEIELDMDFSDRAVEIVEDGYDVVVTTEEVEDSRLMSRRLGAYRFELIASPAYLARAGVPAAIEELSGHACLHRKHGATGKLQPWPFAAPCAVTVPTTAITSTTDALIALAEHGVGIACVPDFSVRQQLASGALVGILGDHIERTEALRAVWPSSRHASPKLRVFIDFLASNLLPSRPPPPPRSA